MKVILEHHTPLPLPSASGIEIVGETAYVIGDDAPFLYTFRMADLAPLGRIALFDTADFASGRIPKALKPDLEAMTALPNGALLLVGSGATPARQRAFRVNPGHPSRVQESSLTALYAAFRRKLPQDQVLNVEALATTPEGLIFFHRPVGTAAGRLGFIVPTKAIDFPDDANVPELRTFRYELPPIDSHPAGLSGATWFDGRLFVTASAEATTDPVLDGEVMGSLVGVIDLNQPENGRFVILEWPDGRPFREKVEGIAVRRQLPDGSYELVLVTDDDRGGSMAIIARLYP